jgi:hypothetical protein
MRIVSKFSVKRSGRVIVSIVMIVPEVMAFVTDSMDVFWTVIESILVRPVLGCLLETFNAANNRVFSTADICESLPLTRHFRIDRIKLVSTLSSCGKRIDNVSVGFVRPPSTTSINASTVGFNIKD